MDIRRQIQIYFQEASIYQSHGLFVEAGRRYREVFELVKRADVIPNKSRLIDQIQKRVRVLQNDVSRIRVAEAAPRMSESQEAVVKELFHSKPMKTDAAKLEIASALLGFGQFESALREFNKLLKNEDFRVPAAKNIVRCMITLGSPEKAVQQYTLWLESGRFSAEDLENVRRFLEAVLRKRGEARDLPRAEVVPATPEAEAEEATGLGEARDDLLDIISLVIPLTAGPLKGKELTMEASSQTGTTLSAIVDGKLPGLKDYLQPGQRFEETHFFTPGAMFMHPCVVTARTRIATGPKTGGYSLMIKIIHG
jgi:tetratricopeptide (TPR) repeat protein